MINNIQFIIIFPWFHLSCILTQQQQYLNRNLLNFLKITGLHAEQYVDIVIYFYFG